MSNIVAVDRISLPNANMNRIAYVTSIMLLLLLFSSEDLSPEKALEGYLSVTCIEFI